MVWKCKRCKNVCLLDGFARFSELHCQFANVPKQARPAASRSAKFRKKLLQTWQKEKPGGHLIEWDQNPETLIKCTACDRSWKYAEGCGNTQRKHGWHNTMKEPCRPGVPVDEPKRFTRPGEGCKLCLWKSKRRAELRASGQQVKDGKRHKIELTEDAPKEHSENCPNKRGPKSRLNKCPACIWIGKPKKYRKQPMPEHTSGRT